MEFSKDYDRAYKLFMEKEYMFTYDSFKSHDLFNELKYWDFMFQHDHVTAFKHIGNDIAEVHTVTRACVDVRTALYMLLIDIEFLSLCFKEIITYVPDNFRGTINFLEKRLGFVNHGECAIRYYDGNPIKVNLLKRKLK